MLLLLRVTMSAIYESPWAFWSSFQSKNTTDFSKHYNTNFFQATWIFTLSSEEFCKLNKFTWASIPLSGLDYFIYPKHDPIYHTQGWQLVHWTGTKHEYHVLRISINVLNKLFFFLSDTSVTQWRIIQMHVARQTLTYTKLLLKGDACPFSD